MFSYSLDHEMGTHITAHIKTEEGYDFFVPCRGFKEEDVILAVKNYKVNADEMAIDEYRSSKGKKSLQSCLNHSTRIVESLNNLKATL